MTAPTGYDTAPTGYPTTPPKPKKKGCGCFTCGCVGFIILIIFMIGGSVAFWYGMKNFAVPDTVIMWTYENVARPKILETLPPNMPESEKQQIMQAADFGVKRYLELPPSEKKILFKEAITASFYYSNNQVIPPDKIPHLSKFIAEIMKEYQAPARRRGR